MGPTMKMENRFGVIEVVKITDFNYARKDIFDIPIEDVANTQIGQTCHECKFIDGGSDNESPNPFFPDRPDSKCLWPA